MIYSAAVITVSDKGAKGERIDTSGPAVCAILAEKGWKVEYTSIIPDELEEIKSEMIHCTEMGINLVLTTGGTGFSPRDVTPEATLQVVERLTPGIPEAMRAESMRITPKGCLSRSVAGIRGKTLIINLPGSKKAAIENLLAVMDPVEHGIEILLGNGSANCGEHHHHSKKKSPSMDQWLKEAKADTSAPDVGMYLCHNGVVRKTARAFVRDNDSSAKDVSGMEFSYDKEKLEEIIAEAKKQPGVYYIRVWLNEGHLQVGDDIMYVLVGGDIRPHTIDGLQYLVSRIKSECVREIECS